MAPLPTFPTRFISSFLQFGLIRGSPFFSRFFCCYACVQQRVSEVFMFPKKVSGVLSVFQERAKRTDVFFGRGSFWDGLTLSFSRIFSSFRRSATQVLLTVIKGL